MAISLADNALIELDHLKDELSISGSGEDDKLSRIINSASQQIEKYIGRILYYEADIVEKSAGFGTSFLLTKRTPLHSISSITYDGDTVDSDNYEIHGDGGSGQIYRKSGWNWTAQSIASPSYDPLPGTEQKLYQITYTAGWITAKQETDAVGTRTLPYDIEDAALLLSISRYRNLGSSMGIQSESLLGGKVRYFDSANRGMPQVVKAMLDPYRDIV